MPDFDNNSTLSVKPVVLCILCFSLCDRLHNLKKKNENFKKNLQNIIIAVRNYVKKTGSHIFFERLNSSYNCDPKYPIINHTIAGNVNLVKVEEGLALMEGAYQK